MPEVRAQDKDTPLIAVTANVMQTDLEKYQRLGFNLCLAKPIEIQELYDLIVKTLKITGIKAKFHHYAGITLAE